MRPNQQNNKNRSRGRNNNGGRKHINPLSRNFESNGPDVKVRGNASHIAEKYVQLARDAQASGDSVMAENYLQHAEHYFRIVSAAQPQGVPRPDQFNNSDADGFEDEFDLGDGGRFNNRFSSPERQQNAPETETAEVGNDEATPQPQAAEAPPAAAEAPASTEAASAEGEGEGAEPRRQRRPRRRRSASGEAANAELANADQPEVGDLPAFITAGGTPTAAE
jgi:hypothetical protein